MANKFTNLMEEMFGVTIGAKEEASKNKQLAAPIPHEEEDGAIELRAGGINASYGAAFIDIEGRAKNEGQLVTKYREMSTHPECDSAIQDVVNEAIVTDNEQPAISIVLDRLQVGDDIKKKIEDEFKYLCRMMDFYNNSYELFKKWYVDGRLYYFLNIDRTNPRAGIQEVRYIDPRKIRKVKEHIKERDQKTGKIIYKGFKEFYVYFQKTDIVGSPIGGMEGLKISKDSICYVHSGVKDTRNQFIYSHLHKAIKPLNQLRMLEDAVVIYRLARAPERRIFYIDVGNLPKVKAEQYLHDMMVKHKNKLVYNASTGEVKDDRRFQTILEDFWLPRRGESGKATEITNLPGGQNLGEMDDVQYFKKKLYEALNVPISRLESETQFNIGRSSEITRDEVKFSKFISRLRNRFTMLFDNMLEIQLSLKGIIRREEWNSLKQDIFYDFLEDNHFQELKDIEMLRERFGIMGEADNFVQDYLSREWVMRNVLRFEDKEMKEIESQRKSEEKDEEGGELLPAEIKAQLAAQPEPPPEEMQQEPPPNPMLPQSDQKNVKKEANKLISDEKDLELIDRFTNELKKLNDA